MLVVVVAQERGSAQSDVDVAIGFFAAGGAYCFRVSPEGVALADQTEWTVMVLTGGGNESETFRIRSIDAGRVRFTGGGLAANRAAVTGVWRFAGSREAFFDRFAAGIEAGTLRARITTFAPPGLSQMSPAARAERYLKFADRGSKVSFRDVPDLTPDEFRHYVTYFPD